MIDWKSAASNARYLGRRCDDATTCISPSLTERLEFQRALAAEDLVRVIDALRLSAEDLDAARERIRTLHAALDKIAGLV